jgi:gingipain R
MKQKSILFILLAFLFSFSMQAQEVQYTPMSQSSSEVVIRVDFPNYYETTPVEVNGETMYKLAMGNAYPIEQIGAPELLKSATSIIVPEGVQPTVSILESNFSIVTNFNLAPSKGRLYRDIDPSSVPYVKGDQYLVNGFIGDNQGIIGTSYQLRDFTGVTVTVQPFAYNPVQKELKVYQSLVVKISYSSTSGTINAKKNNLVFDQIYSRHFLNYKEYSNSKYTPLTEEGELLIITPATFVTALQPLKEWKIKSGIPTTIVPTSTAGSTAAAIKTYITNYYNANNLAYVLIVGDHTQFPYFTLSGQTSDNYFTEIAGSDNYPDILLGKLSAENVDQVTVQVNKFIGYDQGLFTQTHHASFCGIGSDEGPGDNGEYDYQHLRIINNLLQTYTYTSGYEFFEGSQGGLDAAGDPNSSMVANALNAGIGVINYCGHGDWNLFVSSNFTNTNVTQLVNYEKLPFIFSVACQNGNYVNKLCFAEVWLRAISGGKPTGAVGALMGTINQPWNPPMCAQDEFARVLTDATPAFTKRTLGGISFGGIMKMLDVYSDASTARTWLLFGDPTMMVRTTQGTNITASHMDQVAVGATSIVISSPIDGAKVTLTHDSQIIAQGVINNGTATLILPSTLVQFDTVHVVLTKFNHNPYQGLFEVNTINQPYLVYSSHQFNNQQGTTETAPETAKNNKITLTIDNIGMLPSTNVRCALRSSDPYVTIIDSIELVASIAGTSSTTFTNGFQIKFANNVPYGHTSNFTFVITDNLETRTYSFDQHVKAPFPYSGNIRIVDGDNSALDYGETATITIPIQNLGDATALTGYTKIESMRGYLSFFRDINPVNSLVANALQDNGFLVSVKASVTTPRVDLIKLTYITGGYSHIRTYEVGIAGAITSGVDDQDIENLTIYPNPTSDYCSFTIPENIYTEKLSYALFDMYGKLMMQNNISEPHVIVDLTSIAAGVYMIQIMDGTTPISQNKIIRK